MTDPRRETIPEHDFVAHEHAEMRRGIERIHDAATLRGTTGDLSFAALDVIHWVETVLEPHAQWEDRWLYPEIDDRAGTHWATKLMGFEHQQIRDATVALADARTRLRGDGTPTAALEVRGRMFAIEAIVRAHMAREERFLIPLLEAESAGRPA